MDRPDITGPFPAAASDPDAVVAAARAELEEAITRGRLQGDPLRHPLMALSSHLAAMLALEHAAARRDGPILAEMRALTAAAERAADKPVLDPYQVKYELLPALIAAFKGWQAIVGAVLLLAAVGAGMAVQWYRTPELTCDVEPQTGRPICWRWDGPAPPTRPQAPADAAPPAQPRQTGRKP